MNNSSLSYREEEVVFNSDPGVSLAGTLALPNVSAPCGAVVLISGMGATDRDYTNSFKQKPYLKVAEFLVARGIAVLRYDKRGVGKSTGAFNVYVTSLDLARDAQAGIAFLQARPEINAKKIGLIGHSEGGLIASMIAGQANNIACVALLAPAIATKIEHVLANTALQLKADGASDEVIARNALIMREILDIVAKVPDLEETARLTVASFKNYWEALPKELSAEIS
jgi:alpha-beta hydrolase superfamily lysophospholipase